METKSFTIKSGNDLLITLNHIAKTEGSSGYILGIVGNLSKVAFKCPGKSEPHNLEGKFEIISLNGTISASKPHLHLSVSDESCNVLGGHLVAGTIVLKQADLLIGFLNKNIIKSQNKESLIEIYILEGCPWSKRAITLIESHQIKYRKHIVSNDREFKELYKLSKQSVFPQIFINGNYIGGYDNLLEYSNNGYL